MTPAEERFNKAHKKTRQKVECSFGILKKRYACLEKLRLEPEVAVAVIKTCVILHNLSIQATPIEDDEIEEIMREIEDRQDDGFEPLINAGDGEGLMRRAALVAFFE